VKVKTKSNMKRLKEILVPHGVKAKLKQATGHSEVTIRHALRGSVDTEVTRLIRKRAMEYGGVYTK
jgi:hemerythrin superfamily protein